MVADAEQILNGVPGGKAITPNGILKRYGFIPSRLAGAVAKEALFTRGASQMDPEATLEYQAAEQAMNQRSGVYGGYNPNMKHEQCEVGATACDICNGLICRGLLLRGVHGRRPDPPCC